MNVKQLRELLGHDVVLLRCRPRTKKPVGKWGKLTIADMTNGYLKKLEGGCNIGVALGEKSGHLVAIDADTDDFAAQLLALNPSLKDTLRTHGARGEGFWLRMAGDYPAKLVKLKTHSGDDVGEWRAGTNCQSIIHGIHPNGNAYRVVNMARPLVVDFASIVWPKGISIPFKQPIQQSEVNWTDVADVADVADAAEVADVTDEAVEAKAVCVCAVPVFSLISSVDDAVYRCLPVKVHTNNALFWDLARALLTLNQQAIPYDHEEVFELWYARTNKVFLRPELTKEDYYMEFLNACHRAKVPLGSSKVAAAWERAKQNPLPLPPKVMAIQKPDFRLLCAFFREMQAEVGDGKEWFVAGGQRACAKLLGHKSHSTVETWIGAMHTMKVLKTAKKGDAYHCTRYHYQPPTTGDPSNENN